MKEGMNGDIIQRSSFFLAQMNVKRLVRHVFNSRCPVTKRFVRIIFQRKRLVSYQD